MIAGRLIRLICRLPLSLVLFALAAASSSSSPVEALSTFSSSSSSSSCLTIIDAENVRGKTSNFRLTHDELVAAVALWTQKKVSNNQYMYTSLVVDHGSKPSAFLEQKSQSDSNSNLAILFAGPFEKADDVIARDVGRIASTVVSKDLDIDLDIIQVVTSDQGLRSRCRIAFKEAIGDKSNAVGKDSRGKKGKRKHYERKKHQRKSGISLKFIPSVAFLSRLERELVKINSSTSNKKPVMTASSDYSPSHSKLIDDLHENIELQGKLFQLESCLRDKKISTQEKKRALLDQGRKLAVKINNMSNMNGGRTILDRTVSMGKGRNIDNNVDSDALDEVLSHWDHFRHEAGRAELTGDRMLLAENMRRVLENKPEFHQPQPSDLLRQDVLTPSTIHYKYHCNFHNDHKFFINRFESSALDVATESIRLVVVSDTLETLLCEQSLPEGDVLLHLGNFTPKQNNIKERSVSRQKAREDAIDFDKWLANQPHKIKCVLRGSLDPPESKISFSATNVKYVDVPQMLSLGGGKVQIALIPHCTGRVLSSSWRRLPLTFDIIASHDAPSGINLPSQNPGNCECSRMLSERVRSMFSGHPRLWFGGNISLGFDVCDLKLAESISMRDSAICCGKDTASQSIASFRKRNAVIIDVERDMSSNELLFKIRQDNSLD